MRIGTVIFYASMYGMAEDKELMPQIDWVGYKTMHDAKGARLLSCTPQRPYRMPCGYRQGVQRHRLTRPKNSGKESDVI